MDDVPLLDDEGSIPDKQKAFIWSLVLSAVDIPHVLVSSREGWGIRVPEEFMEAAREEIASFERENREWPSERQPALSSQIHKPPTVLIMGSLVIFYTVTGPWSHHSQWFQQGAVSGAKVLNDGEFWRLVTALTLHADVVHLAGNVIIGGMLAHFLCKSLGAGLGWLLILLSGVGGNAVNVFLRHNSKISIGFSTAVFGMVGVLCGMRILQGVKLRDFLMPLGAGIGLLAMLGTAGERVDLGAHLWGLVVGFGMGLVINRIERLKGVSEYRGVQVSLAIFCIFMVYGAWQCTGIF